MYVVQPQDITDAVLYGTNIPEADYSVYSAGTTYAIGAFVIVAATHRIYKSLVASNIGNYPPDNDTKWLDAEATNRFKMFDLSVSSQTVSAYNGTISIVLQPGDLINSLGLINMDGSSVAVEMRNASGTAVYSKTIDLFIPKAASYYEYAFQKIEFKRFLVIDDIPPYADGKLYITINPAGDGYARCGFCMIGLSDYIGDFKYGSGGGLRNFSTVTTFLEVDTFTARPSAGTMSAKLWVDKIISDRTDRILKKLPAKVCLFAGNDVFEADNIIGFLTDFKRDHTDPAHDEFSIEINGIT